MSDVIKKMIEDNLDKILKLEQELEALELANHLLESKIEQQIIAASLIIGE